MQSGRLSTWAAPFTLWDGTALFNTMTRQSVYVEGLDMTALRGYQGHPSPLWDPLAAGLVERGFLVPDCTDEVGEWRHSFLMSLDRPTLTIHVLPTSSCNSACVYCYQRGIDRGEWMTASMSAEVLQFVRGLTRHGCCERLVLVFHGGEPLLHKECVLLLITEGRRLAAEEGLAVEFALVTNGTLADRMFLEALTGVSIGRVQITLDGPRDTHNQRRPLIDGCDAFERTVAALRLVASCLDAPILLRSNVDYDSIQSVPELLEGLRSELGPHVRRVEVSLGWIAPGVSTPAPVAQKARPDRQLAAAMVSVYRRAAELGFTTPDYYSEGPFCVGRLRDCYTISPTGLVFRCMCSVGVPEAGVWQCHRARC